MPAAASVLWVEFEWSKAGSPWASWIQGLGERRSNEWHSERRSFFMNDSRTPFFDLLLNGNANGVQKKHERCTMNDRSLKYLDDAISPLKKVQIFVLIILF